MSVMMARMPWLGKSGACALLILALGAAAAWSGGGAQAADYSATVVYFYPNDQEPGEFDFDGQVKDIRIWYESQVGSTFPAAPVQFVRGQSDTAYYQHDVWGRVLTELRYYCGTGVHLVYVHPSIAFEGGGSCSNPDDGGSAIITEGFWGGHPGAVAHELGHAFALPHSTCESVMWCWWDYPNVGLLDVEKQALASSPFFSVATEGSADGTSDGSAGGEPDTVAPTVKILSPSDGAAPKGRWLRVGAEGTDDVGVAKMELYIDSQLVFTTKASSLDYRWDMRGTARGNSLTVTVKVLDGAGNSSVAQVAVSK